MEGGHRVLFIIWNISSKSSFRGWVKWNRNNNVFLREKGRAKSVLYVCGTHNLVTQLLLRNLMVRNQNYIILYWTLTRSHNFYLRVCALGSVLKCYRWQTKMFICSGQVTWFADKCVNNTIFYTSCWWL